MNWISVEDRLPEMGTNVFLLVSGALTWGSLVYVGDEGPIFNWRNFIDGLPNENPVNITHWRPLPPPPGQTASTSVPSD